METYIDYLIGYGGKPSVVCCDCAESIAENTWKHIRKMQKENK
jgi:3-deoxy-D-arabino-heptulosonate 7-phosphate (DAHP) synthase class II